MRPKKRRRANEIHGDEDNTKQVLHASDSKRKLTGQEKAVVVDHQSNQKKDLVEKKRKSKRLVKAHLKKKDKQEKEREKPNDNAEKANSS